MERIILENRKDDEKDETAVLIGRGFLKQLLRQLLGNIEIPLIDGNKTIVGIIAIEDKIELTYEDGTYEEIEKWDEIIE